MAGIKTLTFEELEARGYQRTTAGGYLNFFAKRIQGHVNDMHIRVLVFEDDDFYAQARHDNDKNNTTVDFRDNEYSTNLGTLKLFVDHMETIKSAFAQK